MSFSADIQYGFARIYNHVILHFHVAKLQAMLVEHTGGEPVSFEKLLAAGDSSSGHGVMAKSERSGCS